MDEDETKPEVVSLSPEEASRLYSAAKQLEELQAQQTKFAEEQRQQALVAQAKKGEIEEAFKTYRTEADTRYAQLQTTFLNSEKLLTIKTALTGVKTASAAAEADLMELLALRTEAVLDADGKPVVRDKATGRPAAEVIAEWLKSPASAHYLQPSNSGGSGSKGTNQPNQSTDVNAKPGSIEAIAARFHANQSRFPGIGLRPIN